MVWPIVNIIQRIKYIGMKKIILFVFVSQLLFGINSLHAEKVKGSGNVEQQERKVESFNAIKVSGVFNIYLSQGDKELLVIEADDNLLEYIVSEVSSGTLKIGMKNNTTIKQSKKMNVYITLINIDELVHSGVGDVKCLTPLNLTQFNITSSCVGNFNLKGTSENLTIQNSGVGNINAFEFEAQHCTLANSGVGNVNVNASEELRITNSGVGNVSYMGDAKITDINSNGVGSVRKK